MGEIELIDAKTHIPQRKDTIVYEYAQDEPRDEVQQGGGNVLSTGGTGVGDDAGKDNDDEKDKIKYFGPMDKTPKKEVTVAKEEEEEQQKE